MTDWVGLQARQFAADLGRLYADVEAERDRLTHACDASLELLHSSSLEDACARLARACVDALELPHAAIYPAAPSGGPPLAQHPPDARFTRRGPPLAALETLGEDLQTISNAPWNKLHPGDARTVVPLRGRRRVVAALVLADPLDPDARSTTALLTLLARQAGAVLEHFVFERRRQDADLPDAQGPLPPSVSSLGDSPPMQRFARQLARLAAVDSTVLLTGETGTGKSLAARALHDASPRAARPFITLNCAAIPEALVESELFGHEAGAFSGARGRHKGRVERAHGGTLFLDEVGELPFPSQAKLLTFLDSGAFTRVGGEQELEADVRILSATNLDLHTAVSDKTFRSDLLYRLNVFELELPPLRDRGHDIIRLATHWASHFAARYQLPLPAFSPDDEAHLASYPWPGNVRELRNVMERAVVLGDEGALADVIPAGQRPVPPPPTAPDLLRPAPDGVSFTEAKEALIERWERAFIERLLRSTGGNVAQAARTAQTDKKSLQRKIKRYGIDLDGIRAQANDTEPS